MCGAGEGGWYGRGGWRGSGRACTVTAIVKRNMVQSEDGLQLVHFVVFVAVVLFVIVVVWLVGWLLFSLASLTLI